MDDHESLAIEGQMLTIPSIRIMGQDEEAVKGRTARHLSSGRVEPQND